MNNEKRLSIALENLLRTMPPEQLIQLCVDTVDGLVRSLPKERGGTKVTFEGRAKGRATATVQRPGSSPAPKKAIGSLGVRKGAPNT